MDLIYLVDFLSFSAFYFLFGFLYTNVFRKNGLLYEERLCSPWEQFFPFRIDSFSEGRQNKFDRLASIECVSIPYTSFHVYSSPFPVMLENPHVIEKHQVWIGVLKKGPDGIVLNSNYETRYFIICHRGVRVTKWLVL